MKFDKPIIDYLTHLTPNLKYIKILSSLRRNVMKEYNLRTQNFPRDFKGLPKTSSSSQAILKDGVGGGSRTLPVLTQHAHASGRTGPHPSGPTNMHKRVVIKHG